MLGIMIDLHCFLPCTPKLWILVNCDRKIVCKVNFDTDTKKKQQDMMIYEIKGALDLSRFNINEIKCENTCIQIYNFIVILFHKS